eukprot:g32316.t1
MDERLIRNLKTPQYQRQLIPSAIDKQEYSLAVRKAITMMKKVWKMGTETIISNCFHHIGLSKLQQRKKKLEEVSEVSQSENSAHFTYLREARMEIPAEATMKTWAEVDNALHY